jgi:hypothetical protein
VGKAARSAACPRVIARSEATKQSSGNQETTSDVVGRGKDRRGADRGTKDCSSQGGFVPTLELHTLILARAAGGRAKGVDSKALSPPLAPRMKPLVQPKVYKESVEKESASSVTPKEVSPGPEIQVVSETRGILGE